MLPTLGDITDDNGESVTRLIAEADDTSMLARADLYPAGGFKDDRNGTRRPWFASDGLLSTIRPASNPNCAGAGTGAGNGGNGKLLSPGVTFC